MKKSLNFREFDKVMEFADRWNLRNHPLVEVCDNYLKAKELYAELKTLSDASLISSWISYLNGEPTYWETDAFLLVVSERSSEVRDTVEHLHEVI